MKTIKENKENIGEIITALKNGAVLVLPTDTVYGLVCDATNKKAVEKIFNIKQRPRTKPLPIFVKDIQVAKKLAHINKNHGKILKEKWPGKFTFVLKLKAQNSKLKIYGVGSDTIALRIPKYKFLNELLEKIDKPLAQTSANISGQPPLTKIKQIVEVFGKRNNSPDLVIDAGDLPNSKPSIIIDLTGNKNNILRK